MNPTSNVVRICFEALDTLFKSVLLIGFAAYNIVRYSNLASEFIRPAMRESAVKRTNRYKREKNLHG
ncbi:hypothetical protein NECAME_02777 [Necator americanus]|uniref:Uncharacterized protein n=1 Tax=Necator americanus TaxID=51031 RepID=W2TAN8_NECAM|nr:hypothetical protein NECAME_02777 [Necator americanus]ETN78913.1 hypothetical protein NECAME_02777 [Necator americanus]